MTMKSTPKLNQTCYILVPSDESLCILKCRVIGAIEIVPPSPRGKYRYILMGPLSRFERFADDMYDTPQDIADHIMDFVVGAED